MSRVSLRANLYMTQEDWVFVLDVMVTDSTQETMASSVITWPTCAIVKLNVIGKIHKYRKFHEGHHFIWMIMKVHDTLMHDMDHFIMECAHLFHDR
jgi:hypothetical protein